MALRTGGRSERIRAAVLRAAVDELLIHGVDGISIGEIARRANVHETSIYRRWGSKANLAVRAVLSRTQEAISTPDTGSLRGDLIALLREVTAFIKTPLGKLLLDLALRQDLPEYELAREYFRTERFQAGSEVLERGVKRGELGSDIDRSLVIETLIGPLYVRLLLSKGALDRRFVGGVVNLILNGVKPR